MKDNSMKRYAPIKKMHGLGNDFIVMQDHEDQGDKYLDMAVKLCKYRTGIGADGLIVALPSKVADIRMVIINADGSQAEMCGNGIRCFAKYVYDEKLVEDASFRVETLAGIMKPTLTIEDGEVTKVTVDMGMPDLNPEHIPMIAESSLEKTLFIDGEKITVSSALMGVPHTVVFVDDLDAIDLEKLGRAIETHPVFPKKTNVNFTQVIDGKHIKVRTWERGAGATLACGTGSCAAVVISATLGKTIRNVDVELYLGELNIEYLPNGRVLMTGPVMDIATLEVNYNSL